MFVPQLKISPPASFSLPITEPINDATSSQCVTETGCCASAGTGIGKSLAAALPPHKDVLVVGHAGFFKRLFGEDQKMGNCEVVTRGIDGGAVAAG